MVRVTRLVSHGWPGEWYPGVEANRSGNRVVLLTLDLEASVPTEWNGKPVVPLCLLRVCLE